MGNGDVRVNPPSIREYGRSADEVFGSIRAELEGLVTDVVAVTYYGGNAVAFKTKCGTFAAEFATALTSDMRAIADAVQASTSNLSEAFGNLRVSIQFNGGSISPPAVPQGGEEGGANLAALEGLKGTVKSRFAAVSEQFTLHLSKLTATDWTGQAKDNAVNAVTTFTNSAKSKVQEADATLTSYIADQLEAIRHGDQ